MTLAQTLKEKSEQSANVIPAEAQEVMGRANEELAASDIIDGSLKVGAQAPDFELPNATGGTVKLSDALSNGPVVLSFYRGDWCPYCNIEFAALQQALPEFQQRGATLIAVSPQTPDNSLSTKEKHELSFEVLSDDNNGVAREFGLVFKMPADLIELYNNFGLDILASNGNDHFELPLPATYVIDKDRTVKFAFVNTDYKLRAEPADIVATLDQL